MKMLLDTDTGVDDAMAVIHAILDENIELVGLTTVFGNVNVDLVTTNTLRIVEMLGADVPVARGAAKGLLGRPTFSPHVHGADGQGNAELPPPLRKAVDAHAVELIIESARRYAGQLIVVAVGPLTNLALAVAIEPRVAEWVEKVFWMGGSAERSGNVSPTAEADAWHDPEAAQIVLEADWQVVMVGLDVTDFVRLRDSDLERCRASDKPAAKLLSQIVPFYMDFYTSVLGVRECAMHSALTVGVAADATLMESAPTLPVSVELAGHLTRGMTVVDRRGLRNGSQSSTDPDARHRVVLAVDGDRYRERFLELVCSTG